MGWKTINWRVWERGLRRLSHPIQKYLSNEFNLISKEIRKLRCRKKSAQYAGRRITRVQIIDLANPEEVIFEGYTESGGYVLLHKRDN